MGEQVKVDGLVLGARLGDGRDESGSSARALRLGEVPDAVVATLERRQRERSRAPFLERYDVVADGDGGARRAGSSCRGENERALDEGGDNSERDGRKEQRDYERD